MNIHILTQIDPIELSIYNKLSYNLRKVTILIKSIKSKSKPLLDTIPILKNLRTYFEED